MGTSLIDQHKANILAVTSAIFQAGSIKEGNRLYRAAMLAEACNGGASSLHRALRSRIALLLLLPLCSRKHRSLLRTFGLSYREVVRLLKRCSYLEGLNMTMDIQAFEVATMLETAKAAGANEASLHYFAARTQYRAMF